MFQTNEDVIPMVFYLEANTDPLDFSGLSDREGLCNPVIKFRIYIFNVFCIIYILGFI